METFAVDISSGLTKEIDVSAIAENAIEEIVQALCSNINSVSRTTKSFSLFDVDHETNAVTVAQELFSGILARCLTALKRQHNTMIPLNNLPTEILAHIISLSIHSQPWSTSTLHGLASVCSRWWRIIITTPSLWATASAFEKPDLAVKMSKEHPLTIYGRSMYSSKEMEGFIDIVGPQVHRWQSVSIEAAYMGYLFPYLAGSLPCLGALRLTEFAYHGKPLGSLTLGAAPKLRHLHLFRIAVDWKALPHLSLETLSLSYLSNHSPSMRQLYQILASSPHLTHLTLCDLLEVPFSAEDFEVEEVTLEHLRRVDIQGIRPRTFAALAGVVQGEKLSSLTLKGIISSGPKTLFHLQNILHPSAKGGLSSAIRNQALDLVYVLTSRNHFALRDINNFASSGNESGVYVDLELWDIEVTAPVLILGAPSRGYDLDLHVAALDVSWEKLHRVLDQVNPLVLRIGDWCIPRVIDALSRVPAPSEKWFCPRLSHLHLYSYDLHLNKVARALRVRNGLEELGSLTGRSTLLVYDSKGLVIPATGSPETGGSSSQSAHSQENVQET